MNEEVLTTNATHPVVRIDNTVHRPVSWWTPAIHDLLKYLESVGFEYSPRVLGFDEQGREILTFMEGESGKEGWFKIHSDEGLQNYARLLRNYHQAIASYRPSADSEWAYAKGGLKPGEIVCHGDFGPWNLTWDGDKPTGIIDWDMAHPAIPRYDVLYALEYSAPFSDDETTIKWRHFKELPDRKRRIEIFIKAYGMSPQELGDVVSNVTAMQRTVAGYEKQLAERGLQPQKDWVAEGHLDVIEKDTQWIEAHRHLFE